MSRFLISSIGVLSTIVALTPAFSADMPVRPRPTAVQQPAPQASNWTGWQIGGNGGGSIGNNNFVEPGSLVCPGGVQPCAETSFNFSGRPSSFVGGVFAGYRWQMGNTVFGVEGDSTWQQLKTSLSQTSLYTNLGGTRTDAFAGSISQEWEGSIRARYGWLVTPMTLIYATGGVSFGDMKGSYGYTGSVPLSVVSGAGSWSNVRTGYTVGAGVESLVWLENLTLRGEYRFTEYSGYSKDVALSCSGACGPLVAPSSNAHIQVSNIYNHKFLVGLGYKFGP